MKTRILICLLLFALCLLPLAHAADLSIGRMRAAIWPEYDDTGVLVIYDGRFKDNASFPLETVFYIPKGSQISDACSLSPKGQHFCQLYKQKSIGDFDEVRLKLPYPNFYLSFHVNLPRNVGVQFIEPEIADLINQAPTIGERGQEGKKTFDYIIKPNHNIDKLEVDIQRPLRAEGFVVVPPSTEKTEAKGFEHYGYTYENVTSGKDIKFNVQYIKKDSQPSQDIKYSPMSGQKVFGSPFEERKIFSNAMIWAGVAGLAILAVMLALVFKKRKE